MSTQGTRGKLAEGKVKDELTKLAVNSGIAYHRFPDARAGSFKTAPADFMFGEKFESTQQLTKLRMLEVKEVNHASRLPFKNFETDQVARMTSWEWAGASCWVIVLHIPWLIDGRYGKDKQAWRLLPLEFFKGERLKPSGSWNLEEYPRRTLAEVFEVILNHGK